MEYTALSASVAPQPTQAASAPAGPTATALEPERPVSIRGTGYEGFLFDLEPGPQEFVITHRGEGEFRVVLRSHGLGEIVLIDVTGASQSGTTVFVTERATAYIEVITDGEWFIDLPG